MNDSDAFSFDPGWRNSAGNRRGWYWLLARDVPPLMRERAKDQQLGRKPRAICEAMTRGSGYSKRCGNLALAGRTMCRFHAVRTYAQRKRRFACRAVRSAPAPVAPQELRELAVWRLCTGQRERNALVHAWHARESDPAAWRMLVRRLTGESVR